MDGVIVQPLSRLARSVVSYLTEAADYPYARLINVRREHEFDILEIMLEPELAQVRKVAIEHEEPVRLIFMSVEDRLSPIVVSMRENFPHGHVHTSLERGVEGPTLCIWEENWHDLSAALNGQILIERIRSWLSRMAGGILHGYDQTPEPLIPPSSHTLVLPAGSLPDQLHITGAQETAGKATIIADVTPPEEDSRIPPYSLFEVRAEPQTHQGLASSPRDLRELAARVRSIGVDIEVGLEAWLKRSPQLEVASSNRLLLIILIPMRKAEGEAIETYEVWAYTSVLTLADLGGALGVTDTSDASGSRRTTALLTKAGELPPMALDSWRVVRRLDRSMARAYSGCDRASDLELLAVGGGAIGSNVIMGAVKAGLGRWTVIDDDIVLPHNTVRQAQGNDGVGFAKAEVLCVQANAVLSEADHTPIIADVLDQGEHVEEISAALQVADLVIDFSASPAVVGWMADTPMRRAASFFFGPDGKDLVMLAEDSAREVTIDAVEAQYFAAVASYEKLAGHLSDARVDKIRYANACQDLTRPLPTWQVQMLSALAAGRLPTIVDERNPVATVWRLEPGSGAVSVVNVKVLPLHRVQGKNWKIIISDSVLSTIRASRRGSLPNETGGVLIGTFDMVRRVVHVVTALPAPPDSRQSPTHFVRGARDLGPKIEAMRTATAGRLGYLGEWHSHPDHAAARPSADDEGVFSYLSTHIGPTGAPFLMMICGMDDTWIRGGWQGCDLVEGVLNHDVG